MSANFRRGFRRLADPKISLASMSSILLGAAASSRQGAVDWLWLAATAAGIFAVEVAKNASGEVFDYESGTDLAVAEKDRSPFSGGKRVLVDGLLTRRQTWIIAAAGYGAGIVLGLAIALFREPGVLWLGLIGVACAFFYHAPPLKLSYRGLGEAAVAFCYGPLICCGTYWVQRGNVTAEVVWLSLPLGLMIAAFLWANEFPDCRADAAHGKRTLVVRLGRPAAARVLLLIQASAFALLALLPWLGLPRAVWLGAASLPAAAFAWRRLLSSPRSTRRIIPAQAASLLAFLAYASGASLGLLLT